MRKLEACWPMTRSAAALLLASGLALAGCRGSAGRATPSPEEAMAGIAAVLDGQWWELGARTQALAEQLQTFCQAPDSTGLARTRAAWDEARRAWMEAQLYEMGAMTRQHLKAQLGWWPVNAQRIDALIAGTESLDEAFLLRQGATVKGLYALETLLWPAHGDEARLLADLAAPAGRRCAYATAAGRAMAASWRKADEAWGATATPLGQFPDQQAALNAVVNRMVFVSQELDGTLGRALGRRAGGQPQPDTLPGQLSRSTTRGLLDGLCGLRTVWDGARSAPCADAPPASEDHGPSGLRALTTARSPEAAEGVGRAMDQAVAAVAGLPEPVVGLLAREPEQIKAAFQALKALQRALATQLVGALGVNLTFNANDGD